MAFFTHRFIRKENESRRGLNTAIQNFQGKDIHILQGTT
jgi:hypothetical protein